jgi:hypothetical protein
MYYSLLFGGYVLASGIHTIIRYRRVMEKNEDTNGQKIIQLPDNSKGIVFNGYSKSVEMPFYVSPGNNGISIPIGGGDISESPEQVYSKVNDKFINYKVIDDFGDIKYINTLDRLKEILEKYKIEDTAFKMTLPLQSVEYNWVNGPKALNGEISMDKSNLVFRYAMKKRYPLTFFALSVGAIWAFLDYDDFKRKRRYGY